MTTSNKSLIIKQLDKKLTRIEGFDNLNFKNGWIRTIRQTLNISLEQLGRKLQRTAQAVKAMEDRERHGGVTLKSLEEVANAMDMKVVYAFLPKDGSLEQLIERKANEMAMKIVMRSSTTMKLEDQENSNERIREAIKELTYELKREIPSTLWD